MRASKAIYKAVLTFVLFFFCYINIFAQEKQNLMPANDTDSIYTEKKKKESIINKFAKWFNATDTNYISQNKYNLTFMLEESTWFEHYHLRSYNNDNEKQVIGFAPRPSTKLGLYFGWRWIFLGYSLDISNLTGKNGKKKTETVLNLYSSKFGVDLYYRKTGNNFRITKCKNFNLNNDYIGTDFDGFKSQIKGLNAYYIFNSKHFSYPAAYSQSTNQKKSCGSFLSGFSVTKHAITFDYNKLPIEIQQQIKPELCFKTMKYTDINLSFGYSYNWVFARNCLFNISLLPAIAYKKAKVNNIVTPEHSSSWTKWMKDINFDLITRTGIVWNNTKYYVGAALILNTYDYRKDKFSMTNSFGSLKIYAGFNFWKRKN